jgi:thiol:disulfide interchange protein DsbD
MQLSYNPTDYILAFSGGLLISFTPCIYPLLPVSASYIGLGSAGNKLKAFILSLAYVSGIAVTYSVLGIIASVSGTIFGRFSTHPITRIIVGLIIVFFGLSMLEVFNISLQLMHKRSPLKKHGVLSVFLFGLTSALMISPCVTPALGSILAYLATKQNIFYGATLLLVFAYGMGFTLVLAGTFSSILLSLPKSGKWLIYIRRIYAAVLLGMGIYFIITGMRRF